MNDWLTASERKTIERIQQALSVDLLSREYRPFVKEGDHYVRGHCYVASEAFYHLIGRANGYRPRYIRCADGGTHWWLEQEETGLIADPTAPQVERGFDYSQGKRKAFRFPSPSKRAQELMRRVDAKASSQY